MLHHGYFILGYTRNYNVSYENRATNIEISISLLIIYPIINWSLQDQLNKTSVSSEILSLKAKKQSRIRFCKVEKESERNTTKTRQCLIGASLDAAAWTCDMLEAFDYKFSVSMGRVYILIPQPSQCMLANTYI